MRRAAWIVAAAAPLLLAAGRDGSAPDIERKVELLADRQQAEVVAPQPDDAKSDCRWVSQTVKHQGMDHTRRVRTCEHPSWWTEWLRSARPSR